MRAWLAATVFLTAAALLAGCAADGNPVTCPGGGACDGGRADGRPGDARRDGAGMDVVDPSLHDLIGIAIEPPTATITASNGAAATQPFQLVGMRRDGTRAPVAAGMWSLEHDRLGMISSAGVFTATGIAAGTVQVRAEVPGAGGVALTAVAALTVRVRRDVVAMGAPADAATHFAAAAMMDPARAARVVYPLDDALMPGNVPPADVQWAPVGAMGDLFRVTVARTNVAVTGYVAHTGPSFRNDWAVARDAWRSVLESDPGSPATITVDRWDAARMQVISGAPVRVRFATGNLFGAVYYWNLGAGRLQRINAVTAATEVVIASPPAQPGTGSRCVACHSISRDGRYLSGELWGGSEPRVVFDLTADLTADPAPTVFPPTDQTRSLFSTFNPDASRLLINNGSAFALLDPRTGMSVAAVGLPAMQAAHPEWSPDGNNVAFISNTDPGSWAVDFGNGDLALLPAGAGDTFAAPTVLHQGAALAGAPEHGAADSHPTWSPDSRWVAFGHGTHSRSNTRDPMDRAVDQPGALYLIARDGGAPQRLDRANGGAAATNSYWPTFSPFTTTERPAMTSYVWLAFYSRRDYGNAQAGTAGTDRRQLWVTAINTATGAGADPSSVPYWLPGQDVATENMAAFWAPSPCRMNGTACTTSADCCSGRCNAMGRCEPPPPADCRREGASCSGSGDCCADLLCVGNVCQADPG